MAIGMTSSVKSKSTFGADTSLFGSISSLGSNSAQTCIGGPFQLGRWAGMILVWPGGTEIVSVEMKKNWGMYWMLENLRVKLLTSGGKKHYSIKFCLKKSRLLNFLATKWTDLIPRKRTSTVHFSNQILHACKIFQRDIFHFKEKFSWSFQQNEKFFGIFKQKTSEKFWNLLKISTSKENPWPITQFYWELVVLLRRTSTFY